MQTRCEKDILIGSVVINKSWYIGDSVCVGPLKRFDVDTRDLTIAFISTIKLLVESVLIPPCCVSLEVNRKYEIKRFTRIEDSRSF